MESFSTRILDEVIVEKIIHYCWFGWNKLSQHALDVIETWKKYAPGYEIKCWNEDNFNINDHPFTKAAYESGRMAFVSDYVRFWAVYTTVEFIWILGVS